MTSSQIRESDRDKSVTASLGRARVQCVVEGGRPEPQVSLFSGGRNITEKGAGGSFCRPGAASVSTRPDPGRTAAVAINYDATLR